MIELGMQVEDMRGYLGVVAASHAVASGSSSKRMVAPFAVPTMRFVNTTSLIVQPSKSGWRSVRFVSINPLVGGPLIYFYLYIYIVMEKVQVYRNLHRTEEDGTHVYSVRNDKGIVVDHVSEITLSRPILRVGPKGNQRVRDEKRKNVHAYIQGMRMKESVIDDPRSGEKKCEWQKITYNPYKHKSFVLVKDESVAVREAWFVEIRRDGVWAWLPE